MQNITENLTSVISQITTMEKENENLKKENEKLLNGFDTDTHILVEKGILSDLADKMHTIISDSDNVVSNCERIEDEVSNTKYYADECSREVYDLSDKLEEILKPKEEETDKSD